jgi:hypothetical protein
MRFLGSRLRITASVFLFAMIIAAEPASALCSNTNLNGVYGYYHGRPGGSGTLRVVVGQFTADGQGNLTGSWTMSTSGAISTGTFTGSYSIAKNCTGSLAFSSEDIGPANYNIILDHNHLGFQMIQTDNTVTQPGFGLSQGVVTCGLSGKKQTFATNLLGVLFSTTNAEAIVGQLTLDGKGNISGSETFSVGGTNTTAAVTGTYTQNADCTGTAQITPTGAATTNFNTIAVNAGKELLLIETDNTTLIAGTAQE